MASPSDLLIASINAASSLYDKYRITVAVDNKLFNYDNFFIKYNTLADRPQGLNAGLINNNNLS